MRRLMSIAVVAATLVVSASGCSSARFDDGADEDGAEPPVGRTSSAWTSDPVNGPFCNVGAGDLAVVPKWSSTLAGTYSSTKVLSASVTNNLDTDVQVSVDLRATGLDGQFILRRIFDGFVPHNNRVPLVVKVGDIPLQAPEEPVQADLVVFVHDPPEYAGVQV